MASPSCPDPARAPAPVDHEPGQQSSEEPRSGATDRPLPTLVGARGDPVAFLDAPGLAARTLLDTVHRVLASLSDGAILTVFTDDPSAPHTAEDWAASRDVELLAVIPHGDRIGTTLTFRRAAPGSVSATGGLPQP
jgi:TusA-related sulfurtransferase